MGRSGSSSKKKYSKKKSLKVSSEARRLKRSKRNKSKKLHRHDDSYSSCSDDDSTSSSPLSSSSSEGKYKSRKSRSRTRIDIKSSKKRIRRRSCSEDSTYDSPPVNKRKRSKKNKKKIKKKKKHRKDAYISSDSESCSTCGDGDSSSDTDKDTIKGKSGNRKNRSSRPKRSSSPNNSYDDDDDDNIENVMLENNPRRLKSVITIATQPENEGGDDTDMKRDELKEEMVYDYDYDYPSCKSNDSNDGETKKELVDNTSVISKEKESNDSDNNLESGVDDLESILRKKALENLSRFRGGIQTKPLVITPFDNKQINDQSGVTVSQDSQPVIQRSRFTWRRDAHATYSGPESSRSQAPLPKLQTAGLSSTDRLENKITNEKSENKTNTHESSGGLGTNEVKKSTDDLETPSSGSMKEGKQTETNDNSQFEKKTMSVMRGGEMVQVSYKVYIPNRAPALARRQLKR